MLHTNSKWSNGSLLARSVAGVGTHLILEDDWNTFVRRRDSIARETITLGEEGERPSVRTTLAAEALLVDVPGVRPDRDIGALLEDIEEVAVRSCVQGQR